MSQISVSVNGSKELIDPETRPTHIFAPMTDVVVCKVNGELRDLWTELQDGDVIESILISSPEGLSVLRHSTAHVLAQAVQEVFPETKLGIGPPITDGFYYDFDKKESFSDEDLLAIETKMRQIITSNVALVRQDLDKAQAIELFKKLKEENAKLVKWWEHIPEKPASFERRGTFNPLTGEVD